MPKSLGSLKATYESTDQDQVSRTSKIQVNMDLCKLCTLYKFHTTDWVGVLQNLKTPNSKQVHICDAIRENRRMLQNAQLSLWSHFRAVSELFP